MRAKNLGVAAAVAMSGVLLTGGAAQAASMSPGQAGAEQPPYAYADCIKEAKKQNAKPSPQARCNILVKKGWVTKPGS